MSQSEWIVVAILAGFLIYLAIAGKLAVYWRMLTGGAASTSTGSTAAAAAAASSAAAGGVAGATAGPAAPALPGVTQGTVTQGGQTVQQYFPQIPGTAGIPLPSVTF